MPKPSAIEKLNGIIMVVSMAGMYSVRSVQSRSVNAFIIVVPTNNKAAFVAKDGMLCARGANSKQRIKSPEVTTDVRPVLPPAATPAVLSMKLVVDDVPNRAPVMVAVESANNACFSLGSLPFELSKFDWVPIPINVPAVSKISIVSNVKIIVIIEPFKAVEISILYKIGLKSGGNDIMPSKTTKSFIQPSRVNDIIPKIKAPLIPRAVKPAIRTKPIRVKRLGIE